MENQYLNAEGADSSQSSQTPVECGINARCAGYATIPRTLLPEERRIQEAGRRVIAAAAASMTHALPICELCEASVNSAFCLYLPIPYGTGRSQKVLITTDELVFHQDCPAHSFSGLPFHAGH